MGSAAHADCLDAQRLLEGERLIEAVFFEIIEADVAADADKAEGIELRLDFFCGSTEIAGEFNADITGGLDLFERLEQCFFIFDCIPYGIHLHCDFKLFFHLIIPLR